VDVAMWCVSRWVQLWFGFEREFISGEQSWDQDCVEWIAAIGSSLSFIRRRRVYSLSNFLCVDFQLFSVNPFAVQETIDL